MKGLIMDDNLSNLTSASGEISASSGSKIESSGALYPQQSSTSANQAPPQKKKRNLPGNPDPDAEVIALSPKTLMARNRFVCEICNKGFQRDQNLQLHRRGHNLPWKLKQRSNKEVVRKKVYVCPEVNCVHHDPSRALGDLTGIKKHFCRKHGEKKWKCEKCSKRYAVQSDCKAHSKLCGTREYRCDCGTLFSRRDSFITHRAFCDALAEESGRANPFLISSQQPASSASHTINLPGLSTVKRERDHHQELNHSVFNPIPRPDNTPPWLACPETGPGTQQMNNLSPQLYPTSLEQSFLPHENPSLSPSRHPFAMNFHSPAASPHMSATALLQKAAQMGVTLSKPSPISPAEAASSTLRPRQAHDMSEITAGFTGSSTRSFSTYTAGSGHDLGLSSREAMGSGLCHGSVSFRNKAAVASAGTIMECVATSAAPSLVHNMMNGSFSSSVNATGFAAGPSFDGNFQETLSSSAGSQLRRCDQEGGATAATGGLRGGGGGGGNDSLTRDFLGLRSFSHKDFLNMTAIDHVGASSIYRQQDQNQAPWHG